MRKAPPQPPTWSPFGATAQVAGRMVSASMLYVGKLPGGTHSHDRDVEVVDPTLPVDWAHPDFNGRSMGYWPAYHSIDPRNRAAYLMWLDSGRKAPDAYIGYVFLYFYGLERRVLVDPRRDPTAEADLPRIFAEVTRLLVVYGDNRSFHGYATAFRDLLHTLLDQGGDTPPDPDEHNRWDPPLRLRLGVGRFAEAGSPVPADWAWAWAMTHPEIHPRTPASRCPDEFRALFTARYRADHGDGIVVRPLKKRVELRYHPASGGIGEVVVTTGVPDVLTATIPTRKLAALVDSCADDLDAYSRLLGRQPEASGTLPALALLPAELAAGEGLRPVRELVDRLLPADLSQARFELSELTGLWPARTPGKFLKADAVGIAQLLDKLGVGIEPDVRLGGPVLASGPAVLFRVTAAQPTSASPEYTAATTLLHLAAVVSAADDDVSDDERDHLVAHLESSLDLTEGERIRLAAHLDRLLVSAPKLTGLTKRLAALGDAQRAHVARFATVVAAVDGVVSPGEVDTLRKIYKLLGQDPDSVYAELHALSAEAPQSAKGTPSRPAPATEPVTVVPSDGVPSGYLIPPRPEPERLAQPGRTGSLRLDPELIAAKMRESAAVAALLADVFDDEPGEPRPAPAAPPAPVVQVEPVGSLDNAHSAVLRRLATAPEWSRADYESLCAGFGLLPEGVLDVLNEAACEASDEPVVEDDGDRLTINDYALGELLA
ncbi:TerB N-terminal domain-containing protein [Actinosynnema pretiosum]|uniref:tellurite resistance TerB family protein n=2 Tax=Actinosynnema TaxID=40566 RepID=UPI002646B49C|nr:TerB N-terminal domain-containing protein [Actinosynnema pretiosum]